MRRNPTHQRACISRDRSASERRWQLTHNESSSRLIFFVTATSLLCCHISEVIYALVILFELFYILSAHIVVRCIRADDLISAKVIMRAASHATRRARTGIVMLNLGGPPNQAAVKPFLQRLFSDREIIRLPMQSVTAPLIASLRAPRVRRLYESIGGGSPLGNWTKLQGEGMVRHLDKMSPETGPHAFYAGFRYVRVES